MNIINYIKKEGHVTFEEAPFCEVDALIIAQLSYLIYDGLVPELGKDEPFLSFSELNNPDAIKSICQNTLEPSKNQLLLKELFKSERFKDLKINYYVSITSLENETQFSAMTFALRDIALVTYRGTDVSIVGWKEDFNMAFLDETPGQKSSVEYLNTVGPLLNCFKDMYLLGHSKGGNLSVNAAVFCEQTIQDRITKIYDLDGPGFRKNIFDLPQFKNIEAKIDKLVPYDTCIGIVLNDYKSYRVIKSRGVGGVLQHDPFAWVVKGNNFIYLPSTSKASQSLDQAFYQWLETLSNQERKDLVEGIYDLFNHCNISQVTDFKKKTFFKISAILKATKKLEPAARKRSREILFRLAKIYFACYFKKKQKVSKLENSNI